LDEEPEALQNAQPHKFCPGFFTTPAQEGKQLVARNPPD